MATSQRFGFGSLLFEPVTLGRILVPIVTVFVWELLSRWLGSALLPGPDETVALIQQGIDAGWIVGNLCNTMLTVAIGFVIAVVLGLVLGMVLGFGETAFDIFEIYVLSSYSVPKIILFPIFLFIFQLGMDTKIAFGAIHGFFPMLIITMGAIREIDEIYKKVARSLELGRWQLFRHIVFPFILVQLVVALRLAFSLTFLGVILAELFASKSGLGLVLQHAMANFATGRIMAVVTILMTIAILVNLAFYAAQRTLENRWNMDADTGGI